MGARRLRFFQAINEAIDLCMAADPSVYVMGLGVPDPNGVFGTTLGLQQKHGSARVMDMPTSENGMTGVAIGSALAGLRPIMVHQRLDFVLLSVDQIVNQAAKWHYMFGAQRAVPLVIRMIIGHGWGQGPQHSQALHSWFAHVPGLKVVMPATPYDAKGLLVASVEDENPVIFIEHRWLYNVSGIVPEARYRVPLGSARVVVEGESLTIVAVSYMVVEAVRAARALAADGISVEVVDVRTLRPLDESLILQSVRKTGRLIVVDPAWRVAGFAAEVLALTAESALADLRTPPRRLTFPECPSPTAPALSARYYPRAAEIAAAVRAMMELAPGAAEPIAAPVGPLDVPDASFTGPF